jgi:hypothetical protein
MAWAMIQIEYKLLKVNLSKRYPYINREMPLKIEYSLFKLLKKYSSIKHCWAKLLYVFDIAKLTICKIVPIINNW